MKKIILVFLTFIIMTIPAIADGLSSAIGDVELNLFGYEYKNESDIQRIERIESQLYGTKKSGNASKRLETIRSDMGLLSAEDVRKQEEAQKAAQQQQLQKQQQEIAAKKAAEMANLKEDSSVDYPIVDKMEKEIFNTQYKNENIYKRLDRLEERVFQSKSNDSLNNRVDKLAAVVLPRKSQQKNTERDLTDEELQRYYSASSSNPITNENVPFQLAVLEQGIFNNIYDKDNVSNRLSRIEQKLFNRTYETDSDVTRAQRLMVAYEAKQSSFKYENNKKVQNMATMSQLGGLLLMILAILL